MITMKTYAARIKLIKNGLDIDKQISSAEREARRYRKLSKANIALTEKIALNSKSNACREVANQLRINYFSLMDNLHLVYPTHEPEQLKRVRLSQTTQ
jgi:cysteinyl-tRNA synthetase